MTDIRFVYVTTKDAQQAREIAVKLLDQKLIACANLLPQMESIYRWEGKIEMEQESVVILKTCAELVSKVIVEVEKLHSYDTPCALSFAIEQGSEKYLGWLNKETQSSG